MILRNGKHLRPPNCYSCNKFFGNSDWNWRCSVCSGNGIAPKLSPFYNEEYQTKLKAYVNEKTTDSVNNLLKYALQNNNIIIAAQILQFALKKNNKYITAKFASTLLRSCGRDEPKKSHLICPFILDWWNMKKYNFNGTEMCYYGRYGDDPGTIIFEFPPPLPNISLERSVNELFGSIATNIDTTA